MNQLTVHASLMNKEVILIIQKPTTILHVNEYDIVVKLFLFLQAMKLFKGFAYRKKTD